MRIKTYRTLMVLWFLAGMAGAGLAPDKVVAIRAANQDSVLLLEGSLQYKCGDGRCNKPHDCMVEGPATVMDASGLLMAALTTVNISSANSTPEIGQSNLKVYLPSGMTLPVRVVLVDKELGVVMLAPERTADVPARAFAPVRRTRDINAEILDDIVILGRMGKDHESRSIAVSARINAVDTMPRTVYISTVMKNGQAVFDSEGCLMGMAINDRTIIAIREFNTVVEQAQQAVARLDVLQVGNQTEDK